MRKKNKFKEIKTIFLLEDGIFHGSCPHCDPEEPNLALPIDFAPCDLVCLSCGETIRFLSVCVEPEELLDVAFWVNIRIPIDMHKKLDIIVAHTDCLTKVLNEVN